MKNVFLIIFLLSVVGLAAENYQKVDRDIEIYDKKIADLIDDFEGIPADIDDKEWVKQKLHHMVQLDQYTRKYLSIIKESNYSEDEKKYFFEKFLPRWKEIDQNNTNELKILLKKYIWPKISEFGNEADSNALIATLVR